VRRIGTRQQRTLAGPVAVAGQGFLTGCLVRLCFRPAPPDTGLIFVRTDLKPAVRVPARLDHVTGTARRTTLGHAPDQVTLVEHVVAALAGLRLDNCLIELDGPEPPGLDGSARAFVDALLSAGVVAQNARRAICAVDEPVVVGSAGATLTLHPPEGADPALRVSYLLDYGPGSPIDRQTYSTTITPQSFVNELAHCRTFLLAAEAAALQAQGIGRHTTPADLLVFGARGPIDNRLRHADEPARHKVLDVVGDLALLGCDLAGHLVAYRSGHPLNNELARRLCRGEAKPARQAA
jgi:UDP-3-O-[3-hydroxymyristoyl] N-acetylglucosamine deacetylase